MKATSTIKNLAGFSPFTLNLLVESQEEGQALYAMFNCTNTCCLLKDEVLDEIREALDAQGNFYVSYPDEVIARGITYQEYYHGKD